MVYLTTHSTHFNNGYYGVKHMVKDHSDSERRNLLSAISQALLSDQEQGIFYTDHPTDMIGLTTAFVTSVGTTNSSIRPSWGSIRQPRAEALSRRLLTRKNRPSWQRKEGHLCMASDVW